MSQIRSELSELARLDVFKAKQATQANRNHRTRFHGTIVQTALASIRRRINETILDAENTGRNIVHVKDGKPLTAHGAELLGVPWKG